MSKSIVCSLPIFLCLLLNQVAAKASVHPVPQLPGSEEVGTGKLTWFGLTVYQAILYAAEGVYQPKSPHALKINYQFGFSADQLARRSLKEIERIYGEQPDQDSLVERLRSVFRDVDEGEHILGVHYPGQGADFYSAGELLGRLESPELAEMFFGIWLTPETREPQLRSQLLGSRQ